MRSGFGSVTGYSRKGGQIKHSDLHIEPVSELNVKNRKAEKPKFPKNLRLVCLLVCFALNNVNQPSSIFYPASPQEYPGSYLCVCVCFLSPVPPGCSPIQPFQIKTRPGHVSGRQLSQIKLSKQSGHHPGDKVPVF